MNRLMPMKYYLDEHGIHRVRSVDGEELLGSFLEEDVQSSLDNCGIVLQSLSDVERGACQPFHSTGNAHDVFIQSDRVHIEHLWLLPPMQPLELTIGRFRQALLEWRAFLVATSIS